MTPKNCVHHIIQLLIDLSFISQVQRRRSLKRNLVPQVNLASSFFPAIPKWREKNQKWLLLSELYTKGQGLSYTPVFISGWKWGSINQYCYPSLYPHAILSVGKITQGAHMTSSLNIKQVASSQFANVFPSWKSLTE